MDETIIIVIWIIAYLVITSILWWSDPLKLRLIKKVVLKKAGIEDN